MNNQTNQRSRWAKLLQQATVWAVAVAAASQMCLAAETLQVNVGEAITMPSEKVAKLAVADPAVADVIPLSDTELSVIGKSAGVTTLTVVHEEGRPTEMFRVEVSLGSGVRSIHETIGAPNISVREIGDSVVLEGSVENEQQAERAARIASAYKANVVNLLEVSNPRQVRISMRLVEIRTDAIKKLGIDYFGTSGEVKYAFGFGTIEESAFSRILGHGFFDPNETDTEAISGSSAPAAVEATLKALAERNAARILSQPTLVTLSGKEASFLSGGEVPIVQQLAQTFTVEFKEFGVRMKVKPVVDSAQNINTHILAEVSSVAPEVSVSGVPSFRTRRAETAVQVRDGQTIVIGGLLSNQHDRDAIRKVPWLGDIPGLGVLFRSKDYQANLSELLVFVTPEVVKDIDGDAAKAARTPAMQDWNGHQADDQLDTRQEDPYPKWQRPIEVDEFKPVIRPPEPEANDMEAPAGAAVEEPAAEMAPATSADSP